MAKNNEIEAGARIVAEDFKLPGGRRKAVAKLVRDHLVWFTAAETRGMVVEDMLNTLTAAGATYEDGASINYTTLSNALWRKRNAPQKDMARPRRSKQGGVSGRAIEAAVIQKPAEKRRPGHAGGSRDSGKPDGGLAASTVHRQRPKVRIHSEEAKPSSPDVLGFMRRAAAMRRPQSSDGD